MSVTEQQSQWLQNWLTEQSWFPEMLHPDQLEEAMEQRHQELASPDELSFTGDETAFLVWQAGLIEEDTGRPLRRLWAWRGDEATLAVLLQTEDSDGLLVEVLSKNGFPKSILKKAGFSNQRYKLVLTPRHHELQEERYQDFGLREATELDRTLLCSLAANHIKHTAPPNAQDRLEEYTKSIIENFRSLDLSEDSPYTLFICESESLRRPLGYILMREDSPGIVLLHDMGVKREYWGQYVGHYMVRRVESLLEDLGYPVLYAEISAANRRSLLPACRQIKFRPLLEFWQKNS